MSQIFSIYPAAPALVSPVPSAPGQPAPPPAAKGDNPGVFVSTKTLATFGVAVSSAKVIASVLVGWHWDKVNAEAAATAFMSVLVFLITILDPPARPTGPLEWAIAIGIASVNGLILYSAVHGLPGAG